MEELHAEYTLQQWRVFEGSSKITLWAVFLHNGNMRPSVPITHADHMKESYLNFQNSLQKIHYKDHQWNICDNLKVTVLLTGLHKIQLFLM